MGLFSKEKTTTQVLVKGKKLTCIICNHEKFTYRESQLNTRITSLFDLDFANKKAYCYIDLKTVQIFNGF